MWISAVFAFAGVVVVLVAIGLAIANAVRAAQPSTWSTRWVHATYVSFAWQELGRGIFFGYLLALGMSPLTAFFFLGRDDFWNNFAVFSLLIWATSAIVFYFAMILPGLLGYVLNRRANGRLGEWGLYVQILVVLVLSAPLVYALQTFLLPPADQVISILLETWRLYSRLFA